MNIEDLTIREAREIATLFGTEPVVAPNADHSPFLGKFVIARCRDAGVHAGILVSQSGRECVLNDARRLWRWYSAGRDFLSGVAIDGITSESKVGAPISVPLLEVSEIIPCSGAAELTISGAKSHGE